MAMAAPVVSRTTAAKLKSVVGGKASAKPKRARLTPAQRRINTQTTAVKQRNANRVQAAAAIAGINTQAKGAAQKQSRKTYKARVKGQSKLQQQRATLNQQNAQYRASLQQQARNANNLQKQQQRAASLGQKRRSKALSTSLGAGRAISNQRSLGSAVSTIASPAQPAINPILLIMFTFAAIIILYVLITSPGPTSGFFGMLRSWISLVYSSKPTFTSAIDQSNMKVNEHLNTQGGPTG